MSSSGDDPTRLGDLGLFVAVVTAGGFTAAARATGLRKDHLSKRVRALEEHLGVRLLARTTRAVSLTGEGRVYLEHAARAVQAAHAAEAALAEGRDEPRGTLRVTTTSALAEALMDTVVARYLEDWPAVRIELDERGATVDLVREGFDLAIRAGWLPDSSLRARRLGEARGGYYGSPLYLARRGSPTEPDDLRRHDAVVMAGSALEWPLVVRGRERSVAVPARLTTASYPLAVRAACAGVGLLRAPDFYVRALVAQGSLVPVLAEHWPPPAPIHAVTPEGVWPARVRRFVERAAATLAEASGGAA